MKDGLAYLGGFPNAEMESGRHLADHFVVVVVVTCCYQFYDSMER